MPTASAHSQLSPWTWLVVSYIFCPPSVYCPSAPLSSIGYSFNDTDEPLRSHIIYYSEFWEQRPHSVQACTAVLFLLSFPLFLLCLTFPLYLGIQLWLRRRNKSFPCFLSTCPWLPWKPNRALEIWRSDFIPWLEGWVIIQDLLNLT